MKLDHKKMRELRESKGLTQREAGEKAKLGLNPAQRWQALESGQRPNIELDTLGRVAKALGVDGRELITQ